ncbi:MAG: 3-oxoacid CoA-transferase subunit B [Acidobacteriota bacterium]
MDAKEFIARRIARELKDGFYVNLGIGLPTMVAAYVPAGIEVILQSENGLLGIGPPPTPDQEDPDLINAGKQPVTTLPGSSYFASDQAFAMIRGGHMNMSILGAMQVSCRGDLANWTIPGKMVKGMGGAMDLVAGAARVIVAMEHNAKDGSFKIVEECSLPLTGKAVVHDIVTELGWFHVSAEGLVLEEIAEGVTREMIEERTGCPFQYSPGLQLAVAP